MIPANARRTTGSAIDPGDDDVSTPADPRFTRVANGDAQRWFLVPADEPEVRRSPRGLTACRTYEDR